MSNNHFFLSLDQMSDEQIRLKPHLQNHQDYTSPGNPDQLRVTDTPSQTVDQKRSSTPFILTFWGFHSSYLLEK